MLESNMLLIPEDSVTIQGDPRRGRSLVANRDIKAGTVLGDYLGEFIPIKDELKYDEKYGLYSMDYDDNFVIYPTEKERNSKDLALINHSCEENCGIISYRNHALFYTLRKIFKGEELTTNYSVSPEKNAPVSQYQCHCGSSLCRGTFCVSTAEILADEDFDSRLEQDEEPTEQPVPNTHEKPLLKYPESIPDYPEFNIYGSLHKDPVVLEDKSMLTLRELRHQIRESGKRLYFKHLRLVVHGIRRNTIITEYQ